MHEGSDGHQLGGILCCLQEAAQQACTGRLTAVADEQRRQQALQDQLVTTRLTESLEQAQTEHQAELSTLRATSEEQLNRAQVEHAAIMEAADAELQQTNLALHEVIDLMLMACVHDCSHLLFLLRIFSEVRAGGKQTKIACRMHCWGKAKVGSMILTSLLMLPCSCLV